MKIIILILLFASLSFAQEIERIRPHTYRWTEAKGQREVIFNDSTMIIKRYDLRNRHYRFIESHKMQNFNRKAFEKQMKISQSKGYKKRHNR